MSPLPCVLQSECLPTTYHRPKDQRDGDECWSNPHHNLYLRLPQCLGKARTASQCGGLGVARV